MLQSRISLHIGSATLQQNTIPIGHGDGLEQWTAMGGRLQQWTAIGGSRRQWTAMGYSLALCCNMGNALCNAIAHLGGGLKSVAKPVLTLCNRSSHFGKMKNERIAQENQDCIAPRDQQRHSKHRRPRQTAQHSTKTQGTHALRSSKQRPHLFASPVVASAPTRTRQSAAVPAALRPTQRAQGRARIAPRSCALPALVYRYLSSLESVIHFQAEQDHQRFSWMGRRVVYLLEPTGRPGVRGAGRAGAVAIGGGGGAVVVAGVVGGTGATLSSSSLSPLSDTVRIRLCNTIRLTTYAGSWSSIMVSPSPPPARLSSPKSPPKSDSKRASSPAAAVASSARAARLAAMTTPTTARKQARAVARVASCALKRKARRVSVSKLRIY